jgi:hypothetical protein
MKDHTNRGHDGKRECNAGRDTQRAAMPGAVAPHGAAATERLVRYLDVCHLPVRRHGQLEIFAVELHRAAFVAE